MSKGRRITILAIWPSLPFSQEEVYQVGHVLIILGFVPTSRSPLGPYLCLKVGPVPKPCYRSLKLLWSRPCVRPRIPTLLA